MAMFVALAIQAEVRSQRYHKTKHLASHNRIFGNDGGLTSRTSTKVASQLLSARIFARVQTFSYLPLVCSTRTRHLDL